MRNIRWGAVCGWLIVAVFILMAVAVKHDLYPLPIVKTATIEGQYIDGVFHDLTVPNEAILMEDGQLWVYIVEPVQNYWLDGQYAHKTEVTIVASDRRYSSIQSTGTAAVSVAARKKVVLKSVPSLRHKQKVKE